MEGRHRVLGMLDWPEVHADNVPVHLERTLAVHLRPQGSHCALPSAPVVILLYLLLLFLLGVRIFQQWICCRRSPRRAAKKPVLQPGAGGSFSVRHVGASRGSTTHAHSARRFLRHVVYYIHELELGDPQTSHTSGRLQRLHVANGRLTQLLDLRHELLRQQSALLDHGTGSLLSCHLCMRAYQHHVEKQNAHVLKRCGCRLRNL
mmetsp:Transcript_91181/g.161495  ORF Transcript_91181/g.161495 Transcript_91181/m.161495 type:complete len:205 (-) Transcript_91181:258-872(-)